MANSKLNSTYGIRSDWSYKTEEFLYVSISWRTHVCALKIRIAQWRPKSDRSNQAIFYYDVNTRNEAYDIVKQFEQFNFKKLEQRFDDLFIAARGWMLNTGDTDKLLKEIIPVLRKEFIVN